MEVKLYEAGWDLGAFRGLLNAIRPMSDSRWKNLHQWTEQADSNKQPNPEVSHSEQNHMEHLRLHGGGLKSLKFILMDVSWSRDI